MLIPAILIFAAIHCRCPQATGARGCVHLGGEPGKHHLRGVCLPQCYNLMVPRWTVATKLQLQQHQDLQHTLSQLSGGESRVGRVKNAQSDNGANCLMQLPYSLLLPWAWKSLARGKTKHCPQPPFATALTISLKSEHGKRVQCVLPRNPLLLLSLVQDWAAPADLCFPSSVLCSCNPVIKALSLWPSHATLITEEFLSPKGDPGLRKRFWKLQLHCREPHWTGVFGVHPCSSR